ncbi:TPA: S1 RNA-binding domain-containing protein [Morganella morganii]|uniref:type I restriction endonuclease n=1 Tax=Morganella morganii TaxID=582 RepID=UPI0029C52B4C|nr:S1 RNA-binding domain-containing protein [Morganella morganii]
MEQNFQINDDVISESDVEQHYVLPLLTRNPPEGFGLDKSDILTKHNVKGMLIQKRNNRKNHFPDYMIVVDGLPLIVIEVKKPGEDIDEAFSEARLYATEINSQYPTDINPLSWIIATDGVKWVAGNWDSDNFLIKTDNLVNFSESFTNLVTLFKKSSLAKKSEDIRKKIYPDRFFQPIRFIGGERSQNEEIGLNSFGDKLISEYRNIFNPNTTEDRRFIALHGYISSIKNKRNLDPISKLINEKNLIGNKDATIIDDVKNPLNLVSDLKRGKELEGKIILIIGSVGSGKTTFIDHLIAKVIPPETNKNISWVRINMNNSPVNKDEIYNWIRGKIIEELESENSDIDFFDLETIKKIYSVEVNKFLRGPGKLLSNDEERNRELYRIIQNNEDDSSRKTMCYTRFLGSERGKLIIIVLDNCDKRTRDEQLLMFEIAQWLQDTFRILVILPLRDETYDNYRDKPPLDTAIKDMVYRIDPPLFQDVLSSRVQLILNKMIGKSNEKIKFELTKGISVDCAKDEKSFYLTSMVRSIFVHDRQIRQIIVGLAGKNIRKALEIFMEFCTSGHITSDEILKIKMQGGNYSLPLHIVTRVLLRMKKRFYKSDDSYLKNLFSISNNDKNPNYFTRYIILKWYRDKHTYAGPSGYKGYFPIRILNEDIKKYGIDNDVLIREVNYLIKGGCLESERYTDDIVDENELLKITSAGFVHLDMIQNINYLAAIAEDTNYDTREIAKNIADALGENNTQYNKDVAARNAKILVDYLSEWQEKYISFSGNYLSDSKFSELSEFDLAKKCVEDFTQKIKKPHWAKYEEEHEVGDVVDGWVRNIHDSYGIFVNLSEHEKITGLIYLTKCPDDFRNKYKIGDKIKVRIDSEIDSVNERVPLSLIEDTNILIQLDNNE